MTCSLVLPARTDFCSTSILGSGEPKEPKEARFNKLAQVSRLNTCKAETMTL
jgi:hypothetical protein